MLSLHSVAVPIAVSSAALAYVAYRIYVRRAQRDTRKLHSEVSDERDALRRVVQGLPALLESAKGSGLAALRSAGQARAAAARQRLVELEVDVAEAKLLESQLPTEDSEDTDRSVIELDIQLAEILALAIRANRLADKYRRALTDEVFVVDGLPSEEGLEEETLDEESLFEQAASLQARAEHVAL